MYPINHNIISSYSGRLSKLLGKSTRTTRNFKVIFNNFPGGADNFELMSRFCYNNGRINISPSNISVLHCVSHFMEMNNPSSSTHNLLEQTEKFLEHISYWTWSDLLVTLKKSQDLLPLANSCAVTEKCLDSLAGRLIVASEASSCPSTSSPDSSGFRFSCDTRSTESLKHSFSRATWWFDDLLLLNPTLLHMLVKSLVIRNFDHSTVSRFLFYYHKSKYYSAKAEEKYKILETVIELLYTLDQNSVPYRNLFVILRVGLCSKISKCCRNKLENMIGSRMDQATVDNILIPSPCGVKYLYDVNLVLRLLKAFRGKKTLPHCPTRLYRIATLLNLYMAEVAPDPCLKPSKFLALVNALPDFARVSYDELYHAIDMYLEVHTGLSEEEKMKICGSLNYKKLSPEACNHLSKNCNFPSKSTLLNLGPQQPKHKSSSNKAGSMESKNESNEHIVLYGKELEFSTNNDKVRAHLQGMQWRVMELEKVYRKMQRHMEKFTKSKLSSRSLPRLCS